MPSYRAKPAGSKKPTTKPKMPMHRMPEGHMMPGGHMGPSMAPSGAVHALTTKPRKPAKKGK